MQYGFTGDDQRCIRGIATGDEGMVGGGGKVAIAPNFNFRTKQDPNISVSNIRDIAFTAIQESYGPKIFHDFYQVCYNIWTIYGSFSFFLIT